MMNEQKTVFVVGCSVLLMLVHISLTNAVGVSSSNYQCKEFSYPKSMRAKPFEVCFVNKKKNLPSNTFSYNYTIYSQKNGTSDGQRRELFTIGVVRTVKNGTTSDAPGRASVKVNGIGHCKSAKYCGNNTMKADCTNMLFGRKTKKCESIFPLFFPFLQDSITSKKAIKVIKPVKKTPPVYPDDVKCISNMTYIRSASGTNVPNFELCYKFEGYGLGGGVSVLPNGTTVVGTPSFTNMYQIYNSQYQKTPKVVYDIIVLRTGNTCDSISINDQQCTSCKYCSKSTSTGSSKSGVDGYQYDCTNVQNGRKTYTDTCEVIEDKMISYPLFPLKYSAIAKTD